MKLLRDRSESEGLLLHSGVGVRVYDTDAIQKERIAKSRVCVDRCIKWLSDLHQPRIIEVGCGTADISGPFSETCYVIGYDCNQKALEKAAERWPRMVLARESELSTERSCDILVMCEFLEHVNKPEWYAKRLLPLARYSVISHPLDGDLESDCSGSEHCWSLSEEDFQNWFDLGGHKIVHEERFMNGPYHVALGIGERM